MSFEWYKEVEIIESLTQGDILLQLPVPVLAEKQEHPYFKPAWTKKDVIVITQACDIEQGKVNEITFCLIKSVEDVVIDIMREEKEKTLYNQWINNGRKEIESIPFNFDFTKDKDKNKMIKKIDLLRKGVFLNLHLLNEGSTNNVQMGSKVVFLRETYQVPINVVKKILADRENYPFEHRIRLLPPYREHLAQAFANVYMRIGLPQDINANNLKLNPPANVQYSFNPSNHE